MRFLAFVGAALHDNTEIQRSMYPNFVVLQVLFTPRVCTCRAVPCRHHWSMQAPQKASAAVQLQPRATHPLPHRPGAPAPTPRLGTSRRPGRAGAHAALGVRGLLQRRGLRGGRCGRRRRRPARQLLRRPPRGVGGSRGLRRARARAGGHRRRLGALVLPGELGGGLLRGSGRAVGARPRARQQASARGPGAPWPPPRRAARARSR